MLSIFRGSLARRAFLTAGLCAVAGLSGLAAPAMAQPATQQITYLLPAPANLPAFAPLMLAEKKGYYAAEGLSVRWLTVQGGADVGKQLASGNGDLGGGLGDTPIVLRISGCPNGCSRPYLAEIALVGKAPGRYNLMLGGDRRGQRLNTLYRENITEPEILSTLEPLLARYAGEREADEGFGDFLHRQGVVALPPYPTHRQVELELV